MCNSGDERSAAGTPRAFALSPFGLVAALLLGVTLLVAPPAHAQSGVQETGVELSPAVRVSLQKLQEQWLQWVAAFYRDDREATSAAEREMSAVAAQLGMGRLPDLALAMTARAVESAAAGKRERAGWALAAAESLDPGRAEIAFGAARAAWSGASYLDAVGWYVRGVARLPSGQPERAVLGRSFALWIAAALLIAATLFVIVQIGVKGPTLYRDLFALCRRLLPAGASHLVAVIALVWPLALPGGPVWFLLWASALAWSHASVSERGALAAVWLVAGLAPAIAARQHTELGLSLSPPLRAIQSLERGRLYGSIFSDFGVLRGVLSESPAVKQLIADFHRRLGQWEYARAIYRQVLEAEPENVDALLALGSHYFRKGEFATAGQYYQRAAAVFPPSAAAYFDLSLAHSEAYQFEESRQALAKARQIDDERVSAWIHAVSPDRVVLFEGGLARTREIREQLVSAWRKDRSAGAPAGESRQWIPPAVVAFVALLAFAWDLALRRFGGGEPVPLSSSRSRGSEMALGLLLPAWHLTVDGDGGRALLSLLGPILLLLLPLGAWLTVVPPAGLAAPPGGLWALSLLGLAAVGTFRLRRLVAPRG